MKKILVISLALASFSAHGALHKWVDAEGKVHYSDTVPSEKVKSQTLRSSSAPTDSAAPASSAAATAPKTFAEQQAEMKKAEQAKKEAAEKSAQEKETSDAQQKNCEAARSNLVILQNAPRLTVYDKNNEPSIMDDDTRQKKIDEANAVIKKYCK